MALFHNISLPNNVHGSGRIAGSLLNNLLIMSLMKGETVDGNGAGSFSLINFIISKAFSD
jgi:hypothetical protein